MATGIKDKVAIIGMGCTRFGERWDCGPEELIVEAFNEALADAGIDRNDIEMAWLGLFFQEQSAGKSGLPLSLSLRLPNIPVTRVENMCAPGTAALRGPYLGQKPRQRRAQSESALAERDHRRPGLKRAHGGLSARLVRLLRRQRRRGLRHRHDRREGTRDGN